MTDVESMDCTHSHPSTIAISLVSRKFRRYHTPTITLLKTATIPTYYGISIAIPRYIAMQPSTVPFMTHSIIVILHILVHRRRNSYRVILCSSIVL